jgi:hypothetical protein
MRVTLTSEDLRKHFGNQVSDEVHQALIDSGVEPHCYAWSIVVDVDDFTLIDNEEELGSALPRATVEAS